MFKKILFVVFLLIITLFTFGYFKYYPRENTAVKIPVSADVIIRVNLREIAYTMLKDVVKHPLIYLKSSKKNKQTKVGSLFEQLKIPSDVFFYSNNDILKNTWVSTVIEIKNKADLLSFFNQDKFVKKSLENAVYFISKKTVYFINNNQLRIVFNIDEITKVETKLKILLNTKEYLKDENSIVQKLKNSKELIALSTKTNDFLELGIDENEISILGELSEKNTPFLSSENNINNGLLATVSGKVKKSFLSDYLDKSSKDRFKKFTNLSIDSLQRHWNGEFNANLNAFIQRKDSVVTYQYDDDFNKIAKTTIQKTIIPDVNVSFGGGAFLNYLASKKALKNINEKKILLVNPLFKTYAYQQEKSLFLSSKDESNTILNKEKNKKFNQHTKFLLFIEVEKYLKTQDTSLENFTKYLAEIKTIKAVVSTNNKVSVKVCFKTSALNFLYQTIK
ncbi:hypothetical protein [Tenacibaculum finnmarkense]|uniref:hypothetical protein n=1 Tax=Tenacibaculum finnmarkense TaxID=2781243 RepID=UPI00187BA072|nr:hypothetical protein [Tenacibaculum finnmarkense]MBE7691999.1 hypothetical protein [Tenacibaculum finnmarkense genomovar finnmarkense]